MKFLTLFSLLMVTLLARNRKHYLVEVEDKNEIIDEKDMNEYEEENVLNHEEKNTEKGKNVKPRKVFTLKYFITNINNVEPLKCNVVECSIKIQKDPAEQSI